MTDEQITAVRESLYTVQASPGYRFLQAQIELKLDAAKETLLSCGAEGLLEAQCRYRAWEEVASWLGVNGEPGGILDSLEAKDRKPSRPVPSLRVSGN